MSGNKRQADSELPGNGHVYGNFNNYYTFHPSEARVKLFPTNIFEILWKSQGSPDVFTILDVGCNEGDLSLEIYSRAKLELPINVQIYMIGIDIDVELITKAKSKVIDIEHCIFLQADVMSKEYWSRLSEIQRNFSIERFNLLCLFSITMWLHVNYGNELFYQYLQQSSHITNSLLIEPQPWRCYRAAKKRCIKNGVSLPKFLQEGERRLVSRQMDEDIIQFVTTGGSDGCQMSAEYWCLGQEDWGRSLLIFHREWNSIASDFISSLKRSSSATT
jgi:SAM-dependent methyltransferase